jgi:UDP-N-acetylmuramoylalanine--D-glutamate ligase
MPEVVPTEIVSDLALAVEKAEALLKDQAIDRGLILLSPACASFDMYKNFEERGRAFKEIVMERAA